MDSEGHFCFTSQLQNWKIGLLHGLERVKVPVIGDFTLDLCLLHAFSLIITLIITLWSNKNTSVGQ